MKQVDILTQKTGRYFLLGEISSNIKHVWFVCHGYGYLAQNFLKWFSPIQSSDTLIVAPEGLHRFYWDQKTGKVGASWMTKEQRRTDIDDYVNFLNKVSSEILSQLPEVQVHILGFSQGAATISRWIGRSNITPNNIIYWAGSFPEDMQDEKQLLKIRNSKVFYLFGDEDEYIDNSKEEFIRKTLKENNITPQYILFKGGHKIYDEPLLSLNNIIRS